MTKNHMLEIHDVHDGKVFCSMIDNDFGHGVFMVTDQLVIYDTEQSIAEIINYPIGKIADDWFIHMTSKYSAEKEELRRKIQDIQEEQQSLEINEASQEHFISSVRKFMRIDKLTPTLMNELIDRIEVYEAEGKGKNRTQRVVIFYRFTGNFFITGREDYSLTVDPQKEIQVHYTVNAVSEQAS
ncbi:MAG: DUF4368 domain-containing protein [Clostridiales bacterium]|nr:DUF4368 domain-containing protein [Clostridiales bacterium]